MVIVSMGEDSAHFRSKSKGAHRFPECIRNDIIFNTDRYSKRLFKLNSFKERVLSSGSEKINIHHGTCGGGNVGTGSEVHLIH